MEENRPHTHREIDTAIGQDRSDDKVTSHVGVAMRDTQAHPAGCPDLELKSDDLGLGVKVPAQEHDIGRI